MPDHGALRQADWRFCAKCEGLFFDGAAEKGVCPAPGPSPHVALGYTFVLPHGVPADTGQSDWRFCGKCKAIYFDGRPDKGRCPAGAGHEAIGLTFVLPHEQPDRGQPDWRYCVTCSGLFYDGSPEKGVCPGGGGHSAAGYNFDLPHDVPSTAGQSDWRFCGKCSGLFYDGGPDKGVCPSAGPSAHVAIGLDFALVHDVPDPRGQRDWRFCVTCSGLFYDGYPDKGTCAGGGGHRSAGFDFVLEHDVPGAGQADWRFCAKCSGLFFDGTPREGVCPGGGGHQAAGYDFRLEHEESLTPIEFPVQIVTGGLAALGGSASVTVHPDGSVRWRGHAHNSGADGYDFGLSVVVRPTTGPVLALAHSGHVGGTFTAGERDHDWDVTVGPQPLVALHFSDFRGAVVESNLDYDSDVGSALEAAGNWLLKWTAGSLLEPVGLVVFIGVEVGSLISTGSLVPGARVLGSTLWMAGPGNTFLSLFAEGIANVGSRTRELSDEEYRWADEAVFRGTLPAREQILLTDTEGGGGRAFVVPRYDGKITVNMGPAGFDDPRAYGRGGYGEVFVHELVHVWQIAHTPFDLALLADALSNAVCGAEAYVYGRSGTAYSDWNLEQQAQVVSDWFAGEVPAGTDQTGVPKDVDSPYFGYVAHHIRTGST